MKINGEKLEILGVFPNMITVPDSLVIGSNKIGEGNGEAKLYIANKEEMYNFYGAEKFEAKCFMLKKDLISYLLAVKNEYLEPSQEYRGKNDLPELWRKRMDLVEALNDVIFFTVQGQYQISGARGYVNSKDEAYKLIRTIALPIISYIYVAKVGDKKASLFYWKLFVDFLAVNEIKNGALVFKYGKKKGEKDAHARRETASEELERNIKNARNGQGRYREKLLEQCRFCPFTMIADERILIASHIKPWAASENHEKADPYNGYILSPMYDKLFDRGFITFTNDRHIKLSPFLSPLTWKQIGLKDNAFVQALPMDEKRAEYLKFHQENVFKGNFE